MKLISSALVVVLFSSNASFAATTRYVQISATKTSPILDCGREAGCREDYPGNQFGLQSGTQSDAKESLTKQCDAMKNSRGSHENGDFYAAADCSTGNSTSCSVFQAPSKENPSQQSFHVRCTTTIKACCVVEQ